MKVSVVLPILNGEKYIEAALDSLTGQTFRDFEVLMVDNGSTDRTVDILRGYESLSNFKLIFCKKPGLVNALNDGLRHSKGEYIARFDADDVNKPHRLQVQVDVMDGNSNLGFCSAGIDLISEDGNFLPPVKQESATSSEELMDSLMYKVSRYPVIHPTVMYRKSVVDCVGGYRSEYKNIEDRDLWMRMSQLCEYKFIKDRLINYRVNSEGVSVNNSKDQLIKGVMRAVEENCSRGLVQASYDNIYSLIEKEVDDKALSGSGRELAKVITKNILKGKLFWIAKLSRNYRCSEKLKLVNDVCKRLNKC